MEDSTPKMIVAVVEDDEQLLFLIDKKLSLNNIKTILVSSKHRFSEIFDNDKPKVDLFWLDFYLGDGDAFDLIDKIKNTPEYKDTPIIIVSNSMDENRVKYMLSLGIQKYFLKASSSLQELVDEVVKYSKEEHTNNV